MGSFVPICMRAVTRPQKHKAAELRTTSHGERGSPRMETNLQCPNPLYTHNAVTTRMRTALVAISAGAVAVVAISGGARHGRLLPAPRLILQPARIVADGYSTATLVMQSAASSAPAISVAGNRHAAIIEEVTGTPGKWEAHIRAGILPGRIRLRVAFQGAPAAETELESVPFIRDTAQDGTPDFLRLDDERDRQAFRRWFTWLAEAQYFQPPAAGPAEIKDCAGLIRYAYRESLNAAAFAQFADVRTLYHLNTHLVSRVLSSAVPGDLLFFRQDSGAEPYHSMIYLGESSIQNDGRRYVLYHTGPSGSDPGEIRRLTVEELLRFPQPEWRPVAANPSFLGVSRWNILRK